MEGRSKGLQYVEFVQYPGETIFVPGGWWHAVLNVDDTVAVTQNFCNSVNFSKVWRKTRRGRKKMACKFLEQLDAHYPDLAKIARDMNKQDNFIMRNIQKEMEKKRKKKRRWEHEGNL